MVAKLTQQTQTFKMLQGTWRCPECRIEGVKILDAGIAARKHARENPGHKVRLQELIASTTDMYVYVRKDQKA